MPRPSSARRQSDGAIPCDAPRLQRFSFGGTQLGAVALLAEPEVAAPPAAAEAERWALNADSSSWPTFPSTFQWGEVLGEGSFGKVRVIADTLSGEQYAVKVVSKRVLGKDRTAAIEEEVRRRPLHKHAPHAVTGW
jgi:serine/threonine protein kinase